MSLAVSCLQQVECAGFLDNGRRMMGLLQALLTHQSLTMLMQGKLIAEQYAPGITNATKLKSKSIIKSFLINYMIGLRSGDGKMSVDDLIGAPHWWVSPSHPYHRKVLT